MVETSQSVARLNPALAILIGTIVVGTLDALDAIIFFGTRGAKPIQIFQSIAAGYLGRAAFGDGIPAALLGAATHYFIALGIVLVYFLVGKKFSLLFRQTILCGAGYGVLVYCFMNYVVIPLSATHGPLFSYGVLINGIVGHVILIGIPAAYFARLGGQRIA